MIICAALKVEACKEYKETIVPCFRHGYGFNILHSLCQNENYKGHVAQGFMTNTGEFLDRESAFHHAVQCGQLSASTLHLKKERNETELYSEDLY